MPDRVVPPAFRLVLAPGVRRIEGGRVLVGGSPLRIMRLTAAGSRVVDDLAAGAPVGVDDGRQRLARRLFDAAMADPAPGPSQRSGADVTVVIPVRDDGDGLDRTLASLAPASRTIVVDDGSITPVGSAGVTLLRHRRPLGPAAARNAGWRAARTEVVAFVDASCDVPGGWLDALLPHLDDPAVAAVAPRIGARGAPGLLPALVTYDQLRGPLDRGHRPATVRPLSPVPYVPATTLVVRRSALEEVDGFDESLRFGEDVDLVWRLGSAGWTVRYEPAVIVTHPTRASAVGWARQRFDYGTSAAPLAVRHGVAGAPVRLSSWTATAWTLAALRLPAAGSAVAALSTALLGRRLKGLTHPWREAVRLAGGGNLGAGRYLVDALRRPWWPVAAALALWRRPRPALIAAVVGTPLVEWATERPPLGPVRWVAIRLADDVSYGAGVWTGSIRHRTAGALRPALVSWPGRGEPVELQAAAPSTETNDTISPG